MPKVVAALDRQASCRVKISNQVALVKPTKIRTPIWFRSIDGRLARGPNFKVHRPKTGQLSSAQTNFWSSGTWASRNNLKAGSHWHLKSPLGPQINKNSHLMSRKRRFNHNSRLIDKKLNPTKETIMSNKHWNRRYFLNSLPALLSPKLNLPMPTRKPNCQPESLAKGLKLRGLEAPEIIHSKSRI